jgi:hypothetical protein
VIYYSARHAADQPLWEGVDDFEAAMIEVLLQLSNPYEPIAPLRPAKVVPRESGPSDGRGGRFRQPSCRVFRTPLFRPRRGED